MSAIARVVSASGRSWDVLEWDGDTLVFQGEFLRFEVSVQRAVLFGAQLTECADPALRRRWDKEVVRQQERERQATIGNESSEETAGA